jgi:hypothetical protein
MKTHSKVLLIAKFFFIGIGAIAIFTTVIMLLWNWLIPAIFNLSEITFWQSLGVIVLAKILFGGMHHGSHHFHRNYREKYMKDRFHERMECMKANHSGMKSAEN